MICVTIDCSELKAVLFQKRSDTRSFALKRILQSNKQPNLSGHLTMSSVDLIPDLRILVQTLSDIFVAILPRW